MAFMKAPSGRRQCCRRAAGAAVNCERIDRMPHGCTSASLLALVLGAALLAGCGETAQLTVDAGTGPHPLLPPPSPSLLPTVNIAPAIGWPSDGRPSAAV